MPKFIAACFLGLTLAVGMPEPALGQEAPAHALVKAPFTDYYSLEIESSPSAVWRHLKWLYVEGERSRQKGLKVFPLPNDSAAYLGGLRSVKNSADGRVESESFTRFSVIDDAKMFMAYDIEMKEPANILVTHQVWPSKKGSRYQVVIHTWLKVEPQVGQEITPAYVREQMGKRLAEHNRELGEIWAKEKAIIEAND